MKSLEHESENPIKSEGVGPRIVQESVGGKGSIKEPEEVDQVGVPKRPKGSSITLDGSGDRSGRDADNSMSLADFYEVMLCR